MKAEEVEKWLTPDETPILRETERGVTTHPSTVVEYLLTKLAEARAEIERLKAGHVQGGDREFLGRIVRSAWVAWAKEQPVPKQSWLLPWAELSESQKEADRRIGEAVANICVTPELLRVETDNDRLKAERQAVREFVRAADDLRSWPHHSGSVQRNRRYDHVREALPPELRGENEQGQGNGPDGT